MDNFNSKDKSPDRKIEAQDAQNRSRSVSSLREIRSIPGTLDIQPVSAGDQAVFALRNMAARSGVFGTRESGSDAEMEAYNAERKRKGKLPIGEEDIKRPRLERVPDSSDNPELVVAEKKPSLQEKCAELLTIGETLNFVALHDLVDIDSNIAKTRKIIIKQVRRIKDLMDVYILNEPITEGNTAVRTLKGYDAQLGTSNIDYITEADENLDHFFKNVAFITDSNHREELLQNPDINSRIEHINNVFSAFKEIENRYCSDKEYNAEVAGIGQAGGLPFAKDDPSNNSQVDKKLIATIEHLRGALISTHNLGRSETDAVPEGWKSVLSQPTEGPSQRDGKPANNNYEQLFSYRTGEDGKNLELHLRKLEYYVKSLACKIEDSSSESGSGSIEVDEAGQEVLQGSWSQQGSPESVSLDHPSSPTDHLALLTEVQEQYLAKERLVKKSWNEIIWEVQKHDSQLKAKEGQDKRQIEQEKQQIEQEKLKEFSGWKEVLLEAEVIYDRIMVEKLGDTIKYKKDSRQWILQKNKLKDQHDLARICILNTNYQDDRSPIEDRLQKIRPEVIEVYNKEKKDLQPKLEKDEKILESHTEYLRFPIGNAKKEEVQKLIKKMQKEIESKKKELKDLDRKIELLNLTKQESEPKPGQPQRPLFIE